jgi:Flp pilus assembly protein TadG
LKLNRKRDHSPAGGSPSAGARGEEGVAAVEFALIAPLFLMLVFGIMIYGIYYTVWIAVTEAATEGARASVAGLTTAERESLATAMVQNIFASYAPMLTLPAGQPTFPSTGGNAGLFKVSVTYDISGFGFNSLAGLLPVPLSNPSATVTVSNGGY